MSGDNQLFRSLVPQTMLKSFLDAKGAEEKSRQDQASIRLAIYHDAWKDILMTELARQFQPDNFKNIKLCENTSHNITKKVVNEISLVYKDEPIRAFVNASGDDTGFNFSKIDNINETMDLANRYLNLMNVIGLYFWWDYDRQKLKISILTPANTSVIQRTNVPEEAAGVFWKINYLDTQFKAEKKQYYMFWDDWQWFIFDEKGIQYDPTPDQSNPQFINGYEQIPVIWIKKKQRPGMFWDPDDGDDIITGTVINGVKKTMKDYAFKTNSFKQIWVRGAAGDLSSRLLIDPLQAIKVEGPDGQVGIIDLQVNFAQLNEVISSDQNDFLSTYGLSIDMFAVSPQQASGEALKVRNRGLKEIRNSQVKIFRKAEMAMAEKIKMVWNYHSEKDKIPEDAQFKIEFAKMDVEPTQQEQQLQDQWDIDHGQVTLADIYVRNHPYLSIEEAEKIILANLQKLSDAKDSGYSVASSVNSGGDTNQPLKLPPGMAGGLK